MDKNSNLNENTALDVYGISTKVANYGINYKYLKAREEDIGSDLFPHILEFILDQDDSFELFRINDKSEDLEDWKTKVNKKKDYYLLTQLNSDNNNRDYLAIVQHNWHPEPRNVLRYFYDSSKFTFLEARNSIDNLDKLKTFEKQGRVIRIPVTYQKMFDDNLYNFSLRAINGCDESKIIELNQNIQKRFYGTIIH